jgi:hypothetical protein
MGRRYQSFVAPGDEDLSLPIESSPWHVGRATYIPAEHWEILLDFVHKNLPGYGDLFEKASYLDGNFSDWSTDKEMRFRTGLEKLCKILKNTKDLTNEATTDIYEYYPNSEYLEMITAIIAVIDESLRLSDFFDSYVG